MTNTNNGLKYSNYSESKKLRIVSETGQQFYKNYQDSIDRELEYYKALLDNTSKSVSAKLI